MFKCTDFLSISANTYLKIYVNLHCDNSKSIDTLIFKVNVTIHSYFA